MSDVTQENASAESTQEPKMISIEVAHALPSKQVIVTVEVEQGCTAAEAVRRSSILQHFPELDLDAAELGVWGKVLKGKESPDTYVMRDSERIEIYRPLIADPKEARRKRAEKAKGADEAES